MRILVVSPSLPHLDASHGGGVYLATLVDALATLAEVSLACFVKPSESRWGCVPPAGLARFVSVPLPQPIDLSSAQRWRHKLRMLSAWGISRRPLLAAKHWSSAMRRTLATIDHDVAPDVVLVEFAVMAQYLPLFANRVTVMTDHESGEPLPGEIGPWGLGRNRDRRLWQRYVRHHYRRATAVQALNADDAQRLQRVLGRPVGIRPLVVPMPTDIARPAMPKARALFLGDYAHHPNPQAAVRVAHEIWPRVRARVPDAELVLAGPRAPAAVTALAALPGVRVVGYVEDLAQLFGSVRVLLAPLFSGSGSRMKVLTALAHGVPVVSNALGRRGIDAPADVLTGGESPDALAEATIARLTDAAGAANAGVRARRWAEANISAAALARAQLTFFEQLLSAAIGR